MNTVEAHKTSNLTKPVKATTRLKKPRKSKNPFQRISAKKLMLVYPQVSDMEMSSLIEELRKKIMFVGYIICEELHVDGGRHFHVILTHHKKFNIRSHRTLSVCYNGERYSGRYEAVHDLEALVCYMCKELNCLTNMISISEDVAKVTQKLSSRSCPIPITAELAEKHFDEGEITTLDQLDEVMSNLEKTCQSKSATKSQSKGAPKRSSRDFKATFNPKTASRRVKAAKGSFASSVLYDLFNPSKSSLLSAIEESLSSPLVAENSLLSNNQLPTELLFSPQNNENDNPNGDSNGESEDTPETASNKTISRQKSHKLVQADPSDLSPSALSADPSDLSPDLSAEPFDPDCPFTLDNFILPPELEEWMVHCQPSLILVGEGGTGKTMFCHALAKAKGFKLLVINHPDCIRNLEPDHDMILFDDLNFREVDPIQLLSLIDTSTTKTIRVLRGTIDKRPGIVQAFTMNPIAVRKLRKYLSDVHFLRRVHLVVLDKPILVNLNVHLHAHFHNHSHIYNNPKLIERNRNLLEKV